MAVSLNLARCAGVLALMLAAPSASAQSSAVGSELSIEELKTVYLDCERQAATGRLDGGAAMQCSIVYEELKRRAFDGDFNSIRAWSDARRHQTATAPASFDNGV